ncbi:hypothetical protein BCR35DRAFT_227279 [Leucosporidium creatinivorum]|uniref:Uncharacterized protein n=1 Tax=Leucosporidium creatinivorum TaxID=106004 RepID=A0A1Y2D6R5_9BASI|nr:hypothetical protein BCR35DRAFT_227279 [Leucosporidium creatinivorum]
MVGQGSESQLFEGSARRSSETVGSAEGSEDASTMEETSYTSSKSGQWMGKNEPLTPPRGSPFAPQPRFSVGGSTIASVTSSPSVDYGEDGLANNQLEDILLNDPSRLVSVLNNVGSDVENDLLALLIKRERVRTGNFDLDVFAVGGSTYGNFKDKGTSQMIIDNLLEEKTSSDYIVGKIVENGEATLSLLDHLWESDTVVEDKRVLAMSEDGLRARSGDLASIWISTSAPSLVNALGDSTELGLQLFPNSESNGHFLALVLSTLRTLRTEAPIKFDTHFDPVVPNLHLFHQLNSALSTLQGTPPLSIDSPASCAELLKKIAFVTVRLKATSGEMCVSSEQRTACDSIQYEAFIGLRRLEGGESVEYSVSLLSELLELGSPFGVGKGDMPLDSVQNGCMSAAAKGLGQLDLLLTERREEEGDSEAGGSSAQSSDEAGGAPSSPTTQPDPNHFLAFLTTTTTTTTTQRDPSPSTTTTSAANPSASPFVTIHTFEPTMKAYSLGRPIESHGVVFEPEDTLMSEAEARAREVAEEAFKSTLNRAVQRGQDGLEIEYGSNPSYFEALLHRLDQSFKYADPAALIPSTEPVADVYAIAVDTDPDAPTSDQQKADKIFSLAKTIKSATQKFGGVFGRRGKKA